MLTLLLFFPSVTFGLLAAEIFPWAILYSVFHLRRVDWSTWVLIAAMIRSRSTIDASLHEAVVAAAICPRNQSE